MELNVCCCFWDNFPAGDPKLAEIYITNLRDGVRRNLTVPHRFVVLADREIEGVDWLPLKPASQLRNLRKTALFNPSNEWKGRVLALDLDNVITGDITAMARYDGPLAVRGRLTNARGRLPDGDQLAFEAHSDTANLLWEKANDPECERITEGREREFIAWAYPRADQWQKLLGELYIASYRLQCRGRLPEPTRIVSMHGQPRPHEVSDKFITENWR